MVAWIGSVAGVLWSAAALGAPAAFEFEAEEEAAAWVATGPNAAAQVTRTEADVAEGQGALLCSYTGTPGSPFSVTVADLDVGGARSLSFDAKASSLAPLVLILAEEDGSLYHTFVTVPGGRWCSVTLPLTDLQLQDGSTDENEALDADQVRTLTLNELANMPGAWGEIFGAKPGPQTLGLDAVRFSPEARPSRSQTDAQRVLLDDFSRPWFALLPLAGARLSPVPGPDGAAASALGIEFTFMPTGPQAWPGVVMPVGHVDLTGVRALRLRTAAPGPLRLHALLEEQDGSRYELQVVAPEADGWQASDLPVKDFTLEAGGTDENAALDLDQLRVAIIVADAWNALLDEQENGRFSLDDVLFLK
jgi:hypothetical protein